MSSSFPAFDIYLIKPTRYDDEGYPLQWWRSMIPSNSLACVAGLVQDSLARGCLPAGVNATVHTLDEVNITIDPHKIIRDVQARGSFALIALIGVQTNQYPRALDLARPFRAAGLPVCIGGFHVSGILSMIKKLTPDLQAAQDIGVSFFSGEAEDGRMDQVLADAYRGELKPIYDFLKSTPNIAGAPVPILSKETVARTFTSYSSFDLGRGCPFECTFCTIINVQGRKSRFRTPDDLERIVRENAAMGINGFFLTDDNFARNKHWEEFLDRLIELKNKHGLTVRLNIQIDTLAHNIPGFIDKCWEAGAHQLFIGLENINADNLAAAKKRQNKVEDYKNMVLCWKKYGFVITCGYIVGFPNDTKASILKDMETLKNELAIDTVYLNYLTPLPGSADHKAMYDAGAWMDPDMNKYDLNHRVTHHPKMSDQEWEEAYREAHLSFYSWDHMERILRRLIALKSGKKFTTIHRLVGYRAAAVANGTAFLESGIFRIKNRRQRRPHLPTETPAVFYARYAWQLARDNGRILGTYARLRAVLFKVLRDPKRLEYTDHAISRDLADDQNALVAGTRGSTAAAEHRRKVKDIGRAAVSVSPGAMALSPPLAAPIRSVDSSTSGMDAVPATR
jgi:uncharacterized radical SAM superfamily protein